jgi:hypothetical protein
MAAEWLRQAQELREPVVPAVAVARAVALV